MEKKTSFSPVPSLVSSEGSDSVWGGWESDAEGWKFWHFVEGDQMPLESCRSHLGEHEVVSSEDFPQGRRRFPHQSKPRTNRESFRKRWLLSRSSWIKRVHTTFELWGPLVQSVADSSMKSAWRKVRPRGSCPRSWKAKMDKEVGMVALTQHWCSFGGEPAVLWAAQPVLLTLKTPCVWY